jgi:hypothetical protein
MAIRSLVGKLNGFMSAGEHQIFVNAGNLASGLYLVRYIYEEN